MLIIYNIVVCSFSFHTNRPYFCPSCPHYPPKTAQRSCVHIQSSKGTERPYVEDRRARDAWLGVPDARGEGPAVLSGRRPPAQRGTPRSGRPRTAGGPAVLSGVPSRACDGPNGLVPKTFTLNSAMRAGRQGRGRGPEPATRSPA